MALMIRVGIVLFACFAALNNLLAYLPTPRPELLTPPKLVEPTTTISGIYLLEGQDATGAKYGGVVTIQRRVEVYQVQWLLTNGATFRGVGIRQGDTLSVAWALSTDGKVTTGVNVYRITRGRLDGRWATIPGRGQVLSETLTWIRDLPQEDDE